MPTLNGVAYYSTADDRVYPGLVALLNSVRLLGDAAPFFVVDCGLTTHQRHIVSKHATLVAQQGEFHPALQKAVGPLAHPAQIMVVLDADVIVNRPLTSLFADVKLGHIITFEERISDRFFPEWSQLGMGLPARQPYVNSGHFILPGEICRDFLELFLRLGQDIDIRSTLFGPRVDAKPDTNPLFYADQDILNAMLCTRYNERAIRLDQSSWAYPPFSGLNLSRAAGAWCEYADGSAPFILHHFWKKPWLSPLRPTVYTQVFTKLVTAPDAPIRLTTKEMPLRLSDSRLARLDRWRASVQDLGHTHLRGKLGLRPAIERQVKRITFRS